MKNYLIRISYDGSGFHGWQEQPGLRTVQGALQEAIKSVTGQDIQVWGTSRTDAGVHALDQCCNFKAKLGIPTDRIKTAVNNMLSDGKYGEGSKVSDLIVNSVYEVDDDFNARFNCTSKTYKYIISQGKENVFRRNYCYNVSKTNCGTDKTGHDIYKGELDVDAMNEAAKAFIGTHDFAAFQSAGGTLRETTVRTIMESSVETYVGTCDKAVLPVCCGDIVFSVRGDGFLYNMVRIMTGTLVEVGKGKIKAGDLKEIIESKDRTRAGHTAPPCGLYLAKVFFD